MNKAIMKNLKRSSLKLIKMANELLTLAEEIDSLVAAEERQTKKDVGNLKGKVQKPTTKKKAVATTAKKEQKSQAVKKESTPVFVEKPKAKRGRPAKRAV